MENQLAARCGGVDFLGQRSELNPAAVEVVEHGEQVAQAAGQPVELPHHKRVPVIERLQTAEKSRALRGGSRYALVLEDFLASGPLQGLQLHIRILVDGRYPRIAVLHAAIMKHQK